MAREYQFPYPTAEAEREHPFEVLPFQRRPLAEMRQRAAEFLAEADARRSVRMLSDDPVPIDLVETAVRTASTAPSGAHQQPWTFVITGDPEVKRRIREAAEAEERTNYLDNRMNPEWQRALAPLGTDHHKEFLEIAPWIVVLFEQRFGLDDQGERLHHYYVKESVGIAAGMFITALHHMGLATLTHTPTPMAFLSTLLDRPANERPSILFPIGFPVDGCKVPTLRRKSLDEVLVRR
ncbi:MAG: nitroreductase family protein [Ilumatobacteraceae bacterium]